MADIIFYEEYSLILFEHVSQSSVAPLNHPQLLEVEKTYIPKYNYRYKMEYLLNNGRYVTLLTPYVLIIHPNTFVFEEEENLEQLSPIAQQNLGSMFSNHDAYLEIPDEEVIYMDTGVIENVSSTRTAAKQERIDGRVLIGIPPALPNSANLYQVLDYLWSNGDMVLDCILIHTVPVVNTIHEK
jgi:hypothetical protein